MALEDMTVAELRDLANKTHVQLGGLTLKADIIEALQNAGVTVGEEAEESEAEVGAGEPEAEDEDYEGEPQPEPQAEVEGEVWPEVEGQETADEPEAEAEYEEPQIKAGGYVATEKGWELAEKVEG